MAVEHHLPDEVLIEYAAGTTAEAVSLVVACHATLCPRCRSRIGELEAIGGALLSASEPPDVQMDALVERMLARLDDLPQHPPATPPPPPASSPLLPRPLLQYTGPYEQIKWRKVFPGLYAYDLDLKLQGVPVRLKRVAPGMNAPQHTHGGMELDLVLAGGLYDLTRETQYERGDLQFSDPEVTHTLRTLEGEECLVLSVNEARMRPLGLRSRVLHWWMGW